jgi:hypothetical protein
MIPHTLINQPALPIFPFEHLKNTSAPYSLISHNTDEEVLTYPRDESSKLDLELSIFSSCF